MYGYTHSYFMTSFKNLVQEQLQPVPPLICGDIAVCMPFYCNLTVLNVVFQCGIVWNLRPVDQTWKK